jgi:hypothetical protein
LACPVPALRAVHVAGVEAVEVQGAGLVDELRAPVLLPLPDVELRSLGIGEDRRPAGLRLDVHWLRHDGPAGITNLRGGLVGAVDPEVGSHVAV